MSRDPSPLSILAAELANELARLPLAGAVPAVSGLAARDLSPVEDQRAWGGLMAALTESGCVPHPDLMAEDLALDVFKLVEGDYKHPQDPGRLLRVKMACTGYPAAAIASEFINVEDGTDYQPTPGESNLFLQSLSLHALRHALEVTDPALLCAVKWSATNVLFKVKGSATAVMLSHELGISMEKAMFAGPTDSSMFYQYMLGECLEASQDYVGAAELYQELIDDISSPHVSPVTCPKWSLKSEKMKAFTALGLAHKRSGNMFEAIRAYAAALTELEDQEENMETWQHRVAFAVLTSKVPGANCSEITKYARELVMRAVAYAFPRMKAGGSQIWHHQPLHHPPAAGPGPARECFIVEDKKGRQYTFYFAAAAGQESPCIITPTTERLDFSKLPKPGEESGLQARRRTAQEVAKDSRRIAKSSHMRDTALSPCCDSCGEKQRNLKKCQGCQQVYYCSRECQKSSWKQHKTVCAQLAEH